jgi:ATP-dependent Clp protease ATP-binding subunit ClpA
MAGNTIGFGDPRGDTEHKGKAALEKLFSPEFRNRLDETIVFRQLDRAVMLRVVDKFIARVEQQLGSRKILLALADAAREWLADKGFDPAFGARPLARLIQRELKAPLSEEILFGALKNGGVVDVTVRADGAGLAFAARESGRNAAL